jgi:DNA (cytosine-5)-methyltransferase 1
MKYLSVCSGIEAATVAWHGLGWEPVAFSEIEKFPSAVLAHHYPSVPNWGDMTKFQEWPDANVDVLVGGTPCQSFSVAGLRKGLDDPRGNLMLTYGAIAKRYRPKWVVFENVPGLLSSNGGRDFGTLLGMLGELGYGFAYRVLDAQFVRTRQHPRAVPQRRRRVFVVGCLGDWRSAAAVLFDRESLSGIAEPSRKTQQKNANFDLCGVEICGPVSARDYKDPGTDGMNKNSAKMVPVFPMHGGMINRKEKNGPGGTGFGEENSSSYTLTAGGMVKHGVVIAKKIRQLTPLEYERLQGFSDNYTKISWRKKTEPPDAPRYKALGNSMAVNCMRWIGERIQQVEAL